MQKVIIITGTRKGIGKFLAEHFLDEGHFVIGSSRKEASLKHDRYFHYELDVSDEVAVSKMVRDVYKQFKHIDVLVNNAGIASMNHFLLTPLDSARKTMETNFFGTFNTCREVGKLMARQKGGRIINFSTVAVPINLEGELAYASSKAAVEQLTRTLARELGEYGITVNSVGPTPIKTDLISGVPEGKINLLIDRQSIKRFGEFNDVLNVIKFYMDDMSSFITGQTLYLGGIN